VPTESATTVFARIRRFSHSVRHDQSRRTLAENFASLTALQYASYIFPLIVLPYLTRVLGVELFGQIAFAQAFIAYFAVLVDFGFGYSATRQISAERNDPVKLRTIFSEVLWARIFLATISFALMIAFVEMQPARRTQFWLYTACFSAVVGSVVAPEWFFIGSEKMKYVTFLGLFSRSVTTILVFSVVRRPSDYMWVPVLNGAGGIAGASVGHWALWKNFGVRITRPNLRGIAGQFREGWDNFLSNVFISLYTTTNIFVLGLMTNATEVGYFSAAQRVSAGVASLWGPVPQVLFPRFSLLFAQDPKRGKQQLRLTLIVAAGATLLLSITGCLAAPFLVRHYLGVRFAPATPIVQILVFNVFLIGVNNILGVQGLIPNRMVKTFRNIVLSSGLLNLALLVPAIRLYGVIGPAICSLVVECSVIIAMWIALRMKKLV
jgi:PST family polysaccharide transporter